MALTLGDKLRKLRKDNGITQKRIAELLHISTSKYRDWETGIFPPSRAMLPVLAALLNTTPEYLSEEEDSVEIRSVSPDDVKKVPCKLCGKPTPEGNEYCHECFWRTKWPEHILNSPELATRRKRSHLVHLVSLDSDAPFAVFGTPGEAECSTSLQKCTCKDFAFGRGKRPCKHIFRLAEELGLFHCEHFAPGEYDYTLGNVPQNTYNRRLCLPEALRDADEELIEEYVTILHFILRRRERDLRIIGEKLKNALTQNEKDILLKNFVDLDKFHGEIRKIRQYRNKQELEEIESLNQLEKLNLIKIVRIGKASKQERSTVDVILSDSITLKQAEKTREAYRGVYPPLFRHAVTNNPFELIQQVSNSKRRSEKLLRSWDADDTPAWAFCVPNCFNRALDMKIVSRTCNKVEYAAWTQGLNFAFDAGDVLYRNADKYQNGVPALQIIAAQPAKGTKVEWLNLGADVAQSADATQQQGEENTTYAGSVTYKDFENGDTKTMTQIDFVKMLIGTTPMVTWQM